MISHIYNLLMHFYLEFFAKKNCILLGTKNKKWDQKDAKQHFIFDCRDFEPTSDSWFLIKLKLNIKGKRRATTRLLFDYGSGFSEVHSTLVQTYSKTTETKVFFCERKPMKIRIESFDPQIDFEINLFQFIPVNKFIAIEKMVIMLLNQNHNLTREKLFKKLLIKNSRYNPLALNKIYKEYTSRYIERKYDSNYNNLINNLEETWFSKYENQKTLFNVSLHKPLITIFYSPKNHIEYIDGSINSVINQSYSNWELIIACDKKTKAQILAQFEVSQIKRTAIKFIDINKTLNFSHHYYLALSLANGEYITFLNYADSFNKHALVSIAEKINQEPQVKIIYSDNDYIDENDNRSHPHFKSGWNPELLFSQNYISNLIVFESRLLTLVKDLKYDSLSDHNYDLILRCSHLVKPEQIQHIPKVIYHQMKIKGNLNTKTHNPNSKKEILENHFSKIKKQQVLISTGLLPDSFRINHSILEPKPLVSLLIPTRDKSVLLRNCIDSILDKTFYQNYEIIIIDNESQEDDTFNYFNKISKHPKIRIIKYNKPFNFSAINNFGVSHAKGDIIGFINNDIEVISEDWMTEMISHTLREDIGCVGAKLLYTNNTIQHGGIILGLGSRGIAGHSHKYFGCDEDGYFGRLKLTQNCSAVTAACLFVKKHIFNQVNGFDEENFSVAYNDVDFCLKVAQLGFRNLWTPHAQLYHHESMSRGGAKTIIKKRQFYMERKILTKRWRNLIKSDPYYNSNLSLSSSNDFSIKVK